MANNFAYSVPPRDSNRLKLGEEGPGICPTPGAKFQSVGMRPTPAVKPQSVVREEWLAQPPQNHFGFDEKSRYDHPFFFNHLLNPWSSFQAWVMHLW